MISFILVSFTEEIFSDIENQEDNYQLHRTNSFGQTITTTDNHQPTKVVYADIYPDAEYEEIPRTNHLTQTINYPQPAPLSQKRKSGNISIFIFYLVQ